MTHIELLADSIIEDSETLDEDTFRLRLLDRLEAFENNTLLYAKDTLIASLKRTNL